MGLSIKKNSIFDKARGYGSLFSNRDFCLIWLAQIFSQFADRIIFVVFVTIIAINFDPEGKSTSMQSWLYIAFTIPAILLTAIAGVFVDRWSKKTVMVTTNLLRAVIILILPYLDGTLYGLYAVAFIMSSVTQFFVPAEASIIPAAVNKYQLLTANSLFATTMMASLIFGFALGDPLINLFGIDSVHYIISLFFFLAAVSLAFMKYNKQKLVKTENSSIVSDLKEALQYISKTPVVRSSMLKLAGLFSVVVMLSIMSIGLSQKYLYPENPTLGAQRFAYIVVFSGIGMIIGAWLVGSVLRKLGKHLMVYIGITGGGFALLMFSLLPLIPQKNFYALTYPILYSYIVAVIMGVATAFVAIPSQTILHTEIEPSIRGKVFGILYMLLSTSSALPVIFVAWGAEIIGVAKMLFVMAIPVFIFGVWKLITYRKRFVNS